MKKFRRLLSVVLMLALCLTLTPAQAANADDKTAVDWLNITDAQLEEVVFGHWVDHNETDTEISKAGFSRNGELLVAWKYMGTQVKKSTNQGTLISAEEKLYEVVECDVKALVFEAGTIKYIIYPAFDDNLPMMHLCMDEVNIETGDSEYVVRFNNKMVNGGEVYDYAWYDYRCRFSYYYHGTYGRCYGLYYW